MMNKNALVVLLFLFIHCLSNGQTTEHKPVGTVLLNFVHVAGNELLNPDSTFYNSFGEPFRVGKFRYYVSNITFKNSSSRSGSIVFDTCLLIDETKPGSKQIALQLPAGNYESVSFLLGVDSMKNVSGAQSGALDPLMDMFWTWNTGYVMAKLEGTSPVSTLPRRLIEYHIGGFSGNQNVVKNIVLNNPKQDVILVTGSGRKKINIDVNVNAWFSGVHALKIADHPACTSVGELARKFSDNYSRMFTIRSIQSE